MPKHIVIRVWSYSDVVSIFEIPWVITAQVVERDGTGGKVGRVLNVFILGG